MTLEEFANLPYNERKNVPLLDIKKLNVAARRRVRKMDKALNEAGFETTLAKQSVTYGRVMSSLENKRPGRMKEKDIRLALNDEVQLIGMSTFSVEGAKEYTEKQEAAFSRMFGDSYDKMTEDEKKEMWKNVDKIRNRNPELFDKEFGGDSEPLIAFIQSKFVKKGRGTNFRESTLLNVLASSMDDGADPNMI